MNHSNFLIVVQGEGAHSAKIVESQNLVIPQAVGQVADDDVEGKCLSSFMFWDADRDAIFYSRINISTHCCLQI